MALEPPDEAAAHWARVQEVFHEALTRPEPERRSWIEAATRGDPDLAREVLELLEADRSPDPLLDASIDDLAGHVFQDPTATLGRVGPYRVISLLGVGGMGSVFLAERDDLGSRAAIKVLRDAALSPARRERFRLEQRILAQLNDPAIARIYDADTLHDGTPYFVMEYVEGVPVTQYCEDRGAGLAERLSLFRRVCQAVLAAHRQAIIHRDLKPSNILVTPAGDPKLLDFGISKSLAPLDSPSAQLTGLQLMTPAYAAPEQVLGEAVGVYTDVYALGVLLFELLTNELPLRLEGLSPRQVQDEILGGTPPALSERIRALRAPTARELSRSALDDLDTLCATALHKDPTRRYRTVEALVRDLDHYSNHEPLEARPDTWSYRTTKFLRRNRQAVVAVVGLVLALVSIVAFFGVRLREARDVAVAEATRSRRIQDFTQSLFAGGDGSAGPADTLRVLTLLERGAREVGLLSGDPDQQSEMYLTLGTIFTQLGRHARADSLLDLALTLRISSATSSTRVAEVREALGRLRLEQGEYEAAQSEYEQALGLRRARTSGDDPTGVAMALVGLGAALEARGEYEEATTLLAEAVGILEAATGREEDLSSALSTLANVQFYAGNLDASDSLNHRALEIYRRLHGDRHPDIAHGLINLAASEGQRGRWREGEPLLREALSIFEGYHGPEHLEVASSLRMLGQNLIYQDRLDEAEPLLRRSLALREAMLGADHPRQANTLGDLAYIELEQGRYEEAVDAYRRIVRIYEVSNGPRHYFVGIGLSNLANALMDGGRLDEAESIFRDVIARFIEARGADHVDTGIARIKLGRTLLRQDRPADAEPELLLGYDIVSAQTAPTVSWLRAARLDLARAYRSLGRPADAERFTAEQAAIDSLSAAG